MELGRGEAVMASMSKVQHHGALLKVLGADRNAGCVARQGIASVSGDRKLRCKHRSVLKRDFDAVHRGLPGGDQGFVPGDVAVGAYGLTKRLVKRRIRYIEAEELLIDFRSA